MNHLTDDRELQLAERELAISHARTALRTEREQLNADRAEAARLLAEARATQSEAIGNRNRVKRLAKRFVRRVKNQHEVACRQLDDKSAQLDADRQRLADQAAHFEKVKSEFHVNAAEARDRLRNAWIAIRAQQKRAAKEWIEARQQFEEENELLGIRAEEIAGQVKMLLDNRARMEAETAGFREEATSLETRIENARTSLAELERRRDRARAELLSTELPAELSGLATTDDLEKREQVLAREKEAVAVIRTALENESADVQDNRRLLSEQLTVLAKAREKWHQAEQQTVIEMEQLAQELGQREIELNLREQQLIRADARRREDVYDLWQLRLHLETWQTKLTAFEMRWHAEREALDTDLERRVSIVTRRETELEGTFATWEKARTSERERLRAELELWADDRKRLANTTEEFHIQRLKLLDELAQHAARALAAEELVTSAAIQDSGSNKEMRRLKVLRKRWERVFEQKVKEIEHEQAEAVAERASLDERYKALQSLLMVTVSREAAVNSLESANLLKKGSTIRELSQGETIASAKSEELTALRNEVERLSALLLEIELPEPPEAEPPIIEDSWDAEDSPTDEVLSFDSEAQAA